MKHDGIPMLGGETPLPPNPDPIPSPPQPPVQEPPLPGIDHPPPAPNDPQARRAQSGNR